MKKTNLLPIISIFFVLFLFMNFTNKKYEKTFLELDDTTFIIPIIENEDSQNENDKYIRTLKVGYVDRLDKPIKLQNGDKLFYRCSYESQMIFYSESDSLVMASWKRMSCEVIAFFNLNENEVKWVKENSINRIKIRNVTTNFEKTFKNDEPEFLQALFIRFNK